MNIIASLKNFWMAFSRAVGRVNTKVILTIFYFFLGLPAIILTLLRKDSLDRSFSNKPSYWKNKLQEKQTLERTRRQF